jgi:hypothetical protein
MIREWLLIAYLGTTTNFTVISSHPTRISCDRARTEWLAAQSNPNLVIACTQNLSEGRSQLPSRSGSQGLVK